MRKISVQSAGSEAARRVASRAPGPNVAPGGVAWARWWASRDATACGGRRRQHQQLDGARHVRRARGRVVDRTLVHRRNPLGGLGRPAEHGRDPGALRLEGERAADRTEADDAEGVGPHAEEAIRAGPGTLARGGHASLVPVVGWKRTGSPRSGLPAFGTTGNA